MNPRYQGWSRYDAIEQEVIGQRIVEYQQETLPLELIVNIGDTFHMHALGVRL